MGGALGLAAGLPPNTDHVFSRYKRMSTYSRAKYLGLRLGGLLLFFFIDYHFSTISIKVQSLEFHVKGAVLE